MKDEGGRRQRAGRLLQIFGLLLLIASTARAEHAAFDAEHAAFDLVIRHGRVVDGTGNPAVYADVAIRGARIVAIGRDLPAGRAEIEATGRIVAPGFIDVHTHSEDITDLPLAENFLRMGVTTLVTGNCGGSEPDVRAFFARITRVHVSPNVATLIGHNTVRRLAMGGNLNRPPTSAEMAAMKAMVARAMRDGALGLSTGLIYLPGTYSKTDEIVELARVVSTFGGIYTSHMRNEGTGIFTALEEVFRVAREAHLPAEISHIKLGGNAAWGQADRVLAAIEAARAEGLDVTQDQYVYTASSTTFGALVPDWAREGGSGRYAARLADPAQKARMVAEMKATLQRSGRQDYRYAVIASFPHDRALNGLPLPEAAQRRRGASTLDDQIETILELERDGGASGVFHGIDERDLQRFLQHPNTMIASDGGPKRPSEDVPHPRSYGNNARVLGRYVRELRLLRLEDAVRRMTSLPAATFRLRDRGVLRPGAWADVVVFDPARVTDPATYAAPHQFAVGIDDVLVNGVPVVRNGQHTGARPGRPLRRGE